MPATKLKQFLDDNDVRYVVTTHSLAYTAQEVAASAHVSGRDFAKTVIVKIDGDWAMAVLPANRKVDIQELREITGGDRVKLAAEDEFRDVFPDCEPGAMPPFGNLYGMDVFVAPSLADEEEIAFNAGSHTEIIKMSFGDFERLVKPKVLSFTT